MTCHRLIKIDQPGCWDTAVSRSGEHDCYHRWAYHELVHRQGEGDPFLLVFEDHEHTAALPFLRRSISEVEGLEDCRMADGSSAYGYPGVITTMPKCAEDAGRFRDRFQQALRDALEELGIVSLFLRQNPLIDSNWVLHGLPSADLCGLTVAVDLATPDDEQWAAYRADHRRDVRRARKNGATICEDPDFKNIDTFAELYRKTMDAAAADDYYYFSNEYFADLKALFGDRVILLFCRRGNDVISGAIFLICNGIIQYHLSGTDPEFRKFRGGMKLLIDHVRTWGTRNGYRWLHLGGGRGSQRDSLFEFKAGFSQVCLPYQASMIVADRSTYARLVARRRQWAAERLLPAPAGNFFPEYRSPVVRRAA